MSDRLFSGKQIVGISIFSLIGLLFLVTGFQFNVEMPALDFSMPEFNPFGYPKSNQVEVEQKQWTSNKDKVYATLTKNFSPSTMKTKLDPQRIEIDNASCEQLAEWYRVHTGWTLRDYILFVANEKGCI